jgi:hypothetical protein
VVRGEVCGFVEKDIRGLLFWDKRRLGVRVGRLVYHNRGSFVYFLFVRRKESGPNVAIRGHDPGKDHSFINGDSFCLHQNCLAKGVRMECSPRG